MSQSLSAVYVHLVFATKDRRPWMRDQKLRDEMHAYLGAVSREMDCPLLRAGGVEDHVHLLGRLSRRRSQAEWVKELKRKSSAWIKQRDALASDFAWQSGYGAFSVSSSRIQTVVTYIERQAEHHRQVGFADELRSLLQRHGLDWDEAHLWD